MTARGGRQNDGAGGCARMTTRGNDGEGWLRENDGARGNDDAIRSALTTTP